MAWVLIILVTITAIEGIWATWFLVRSHYSHKRWRREGVCNSGFIDHNWKWIGAGEFGDDYVCPQCRIQVTMTENKEPDAYMRDVLSKTDLMPQQLTNDEIPIDFRIIAKEPV